MANLGTITYTAITWTAGDVITEAKMDSMVANDQAYDSHSAQGILLDNNKAYCGKTSGGSNKNLLYINGSDEGILGMISGWVEADETWTYSSVDDPIGVITAPSDATTRYSVGQRLRFTNGGNTIYGIIVAVTSTSVTFLHEINPADSEALHLMANSAITNPYYSPMKAPLGFPTDPRKWTVKVADTSDRNQASPVAGTWYNIGGINVNIPIGSWDPRIKVCGSFTRSSAGNCAIHVTFSTGSSSQSNDEYSNRIASFAAQTFIAGAFSFSGPTIIVSSKTTYYLNAMAPYSGGTQLSFVNSDQAAVIELICAYL